MERPDPRKQIIAESRILVVDDSVTNRLMLVEFCRLAGFTHIMEACDGKEGLDLILSWKPDLVFLDLHMPRMDGLQVCQELQRLKLAEDIIIIMQTTSDSTDFKTRSFNAGVTDFIAKPLYPKEVIARSMAHLERRYLHRQVEQNYQRIAGELKEATLLQTSLLPNKERLADIHKTCGLDIAFHYHPSTELAGDYLSVQKLPDDRVALISADVSGHGVSAALYAFTIHAFMEERSTMLMKPNEILEALNTRLHALSAHGKFATMFIGIIDPHQHVLDYAAAASPSPFLLSNDSVTILDTRGDLLGMDKIATFSNHSIHFNEGDALLLYSDALTETASPMGEYMKEIDIAAILSKNRLNDANGLIDCITKEFYANFSKIPSDDLSVLICRG